MKRQTFKNSNRLTFSYDEVKDLYRAFGQLNRFCRSMFVHHAIYARQAEKKGGGACPRCFSSYLKEPEIELARLEESLLSVENGGKCTLILLDNLFDFQPIAKFILILQSFLRDGDDIPF